MTRIGVSAWIAAAVIVACGGVASAGFGDLPQDKKPAFGAYDMAISQEGLPEGWKMQPAGTPSDDAKAINAEAKAATEATQGKASPVERIANTADGKAVAFVLLDIDEKGPELAKDLETRAAAKGWTTARFGTPWRLLVVAGPEAARKAAVDAQLRFGSKMLGITAMSAAESGRGVRAEEFAKGAVAVDPKSAPGHFVLARVAAARLASEEKGITVADVFGQLKAASDKDAHDPVGNDEMVPTKLRIADLMINIAGLDAKKAAEEAKKETDEGKKAAEQANKAAEEANKAARDLYKEALASAKDVKAVARAVLLGARYNLACAHGRLKEIDDAFTDLIAVLDEDVKEPIEGIEHWRKDADFENIQSDPRWKTLLEKYPTREPKGGGDDHGGN